MQTQYITVSGNINLVVNEMMQFYGGKFHFGVINRLYPEFSFLLVLFFHIYKETSKLDLGLE